MDNPRHGKKGSMDHSENCKSSSQKLLFLGHHYLLGYNSSYALSF